MKNLFTRLSVLVLTLLMAVSFAACGTTAPDPNAVEAAADTAAAQDTTVPVEEADVPAADTTLPDAEEAAVPAQTVSSGKINLQAVYDAYRAEVDRVYDLNAHAENEFGEYGRNAEDTSFCLYDFDADGIPELLLDHGYKTNTMDDGVGIYTYSPAKGMILLGSASAFAGDFFDETPGDGEFGLLCFYHDRSAEYKYKIVGETLKETVVTDWHEVDPLAEPSEYETATARIEPFVIAQPEDWYNASEADSVFAGF